MIALFLWVQAGQVAVTATVDRDRAPIGEQISYSLRAVTSLSGAFRVELPEVTGLEVVERTERLDPVLGSNPPARAFQLELTLRAAEVGRWRFSPVLVFVGSTTEVAPEVEVVVSATSNADANRNPRLIELIQRVPPPDPGQNATLAIVASSAEVYQGDQLDVLTAAWFPRSLRNRLRRPPTLKPPVLAGVWTVPQPPLPGIVSSRTIGEETYDLFVSHQVAFPLTAGSLVIPPARLEYAVPLTRRASGDERPIEEASPPITIDVVPPAAAPGGFRGPHGRALQVGYRIRSLPARAGEVLPIEVTVSGFGNLAFWPPPNVPWPMGTRAYLDRVSETGQPQAGRLGGVKTFHFLLLADSVGSVALPPIDYPYFDTDRGDYRAAKGIGLVIPVLTGTRSGPPREPPALVAIRDDPTWYLTRGMSGWLVPVLAGTPVLLLLGYAGLRRYRRRPSAPRRPDDLVALERLVIRLVPEADRGHLERLESAFRRAGIGATTARRLATLKSQLDADRFGPTGGDGPIALVGAVSDALARVPRPVRQSIGLGCLPIVAMASTALAQPESPDRLYRDGAVLASVAGFRARVDREPTRWQHWYHLGAALYLADRDAEAAAVLDQALALAPRAESPRALWANLERQYEPLRAAVHPPWSRSERTAAALVLWWLALATLARRPSRPAVPVAVALAASIIGFAPDLGGARPDAFVRGEPRLLEAPHGLAADRGQLARLTPVRVMAQRPGWLLVVDRQGSQGWIASSAVATARGGGGP